MSDVEGLALCSGDGCGARIRWALTVGGKRIPLDPDPSPGGNVVRVDQDGQHRVRVLTGDELPAQQEAWVPHHRTCPAAADFRRRKRITTARCQVCRDALDVTLAARGGWYGRWHATCAPPADIRGRVDQHRPPPAAGDGPEQQELTA